MAAFRVTPDVLKPPSLRLDRLDLIARVRLRAELVNQHRSALL